MISRLSAKLLGRVYGERFSLRRIEIDWYIDKKILYDFLYENEYEPWFLNLVEITYLKLPRSLAEFIMKIHTGETLASATPRWTQEQREELGQKYLEKMAEDIIKDQEKSGFTPQDDHNKLMSSLELDGYIWNAASKKLLFSEAAVLDVQEEQGILMSLAAELSLDNQKTIFHHLTLSEEHYVAGKWDDSIANSRKVLEAVLQEVAAKISTVLESKALEKETYDKAVLVRKYLKDKGILEAKEEQAIASTYGLLSDTGGHPYIAEKDQARLMRHLALTYSQFVMLRLNGFLSQHKS
jgi:hypothetical protein